MSVTDTPRKSDPRLLETLSRDEVDAIEAVAAKLPDRASAAAEALAIVQQHRGWVSDLTVGAIARLLGMSAAEVDAIATFYKLIYRRAVGRHVVMYCNSVSCHIMGYRAVRDRLVQLLGTEDGGTTNDGRFTLLPIVCLGACDKAPALMIDDELIGNVGPDDLESLLGRYD